MASTVDFRALMAQFSDLLLLKMVCWQARVILVLMVLGFALDAWKHLR